MSTRNERRKSQNKEVKYWGIFLSFMVSAIQTSEKFKVQRKGKPVIVEVTAKKEHIFLVFHTSYEVEYTYEGKTYSDKVNKKIYDKLDVDTKIEALKYKREVKLHDSYDSD
ncbi:hypothetical protein [Bacillus cereus group sp. BfR-BA-01380]|uniref:hypothetical protein n=1 Tax=Bacillus cereus group sp. BfR-BA-01380 TaxID=2920324 RepID=UPI001F563F64|nr:hypothetical protein [Bacillus cereus group sp. BfR-BA-01380]